jgi:hypothetical protein
VYVTEAILNSVRILFGVAISVVNCICVSNEQLNQLGKLIIHFLIFTLKYRLFFCEDEYSRIFFETCSLLPRRPCSKLYQILISVSFNIKFSLSLR